MQGVPPPYTCRFMVNRGGLALCIHATVTCTCSIIRDIPVKPPNLMQDVCKKKVQRLYGKKNKNAALRENVPTVNKAVNSE